MKKLTPAPDWIISKPIAHRAYHHKNKSTPENSMGAFVAAVEAGFSIECDLQVSKTGEPVVFHDPVLGRMTGKQGNVHDFTPSELAKLQLLDSENYIQTLSEHLSYVAGRTPLVLELKGFFGFDSGYVEAVADALESYQGPVCVMSFNHRLCSQFKTLMPHIPRGLTAEGGDDSYQKHRDAMYDYDLQFVSYKVADLPNRFVSEMQGEGLPIISWTVRDEKAREATIKHADQMTFEGFDPRDLAHGG